VADLADRADFEAAYRRLAPLAMGVARRVLRDPVSAEDVVQDVFLHLWRNPRAWDPARGPLERYVSVLAWSRAVDRRRARSSLELARRRLAGEARARYRGGAPPVDEVALRRERRRELLAVVDTLPCDQREAVVLAFWRGWSAREIALDRALPLGTAKSRIRLGLNRVRKDLGEVA
jgi:RNA polymerase sigma-70 factor, ECF subfamily